MNTKTNTNNNTLKYNPKMEQLLKKLVNDKVITKKEVYNAMLQVDRADFVDKSTAYIDR